jgi:hypothetical protein
MKNPFTAHPGATDNPEGYWAHFRRAFGNGFVLLWGGFVAIIHAIFPWMFEFTTSEIITRLYWTTIHPSGRHADLIEKWKPRDIHLTQYPTRYDSPAIEMYQCEPAEVEAHPTHNWQPGHKGPRDE